MPRFVQPDEYDPLMKHQASEQGMLTTNRVRAEAVGTDDNIAQSVARRSEGLPCLGCRETLGRLRALAGL